MQEKIISQHAKSKNIVHPTSAITNRKLMLDK